MNTSMLVRAHDPITSVLAAEASGAFAGAHCDRILPELFRNGKACVAQVNSEDLVRNGNRVWEAA